MSQIELQDQILHLLENLRGTEPLKKLFWSTLNYDQVNKPISRRGWIESASSVLADDPTLLAAAGEEQVFHIVYSRLAKDRLSLADERVVTARLLKDHPYALFVFSDHAQTNWHFLNVKYAEETPTRLFRRLTVASAERLRTASEVISKLDIEQFGAPSSALSPLTIQRCHDSAFNIEPVQKKFFSTFAILYHAIADDIAAVPDLIYFSGPPASWKSSIFMLPL